MKSFVALFLIAMCASSVLTPLLRRFCERYRLVDEPRDDRRLHVKPIPRLGGVAIFLSVLIALSSLLFVHNLLTETLHFQTRKILAFLICGAIVLLLGSYDDVRGANATVKFATLAAVAILFYGLGGRIAGLSIPFVGSITLPPMVGFLLTVIWVVGIANAFNLIDGIDGLATGSALFSSLIILVISLLQGYSYVTVMALVLIGSLAGFLRYNFNPASIFLGDSGALFVGFSLAALSVQGAQKASTAVAIAIPVFAFALPVVDTAVTIGRRFISGRPIFKGDREHIHHMLLARGWSQRRVALVLYGVSATFGLMAMLFVNTSNPVIAVSLFVVGVAVVTAVGHLRYPEVEEIRASMKRNIGERRVRAANNIRVRRASRRISGARTLNELFDGVLEMLEFDEFISATVQLSYDGKAEVNARALELSRGGASIGRAELREGRIHWNWHRDGIEEMLNPDRFWTLRLPLATERATLGYLNLYRHLESEPMRVDVNYLCSMFRLQMSEAAERILSACAEEPARQLTASAGSMGR